MPLEVKIAVAANPTSPLNKFTKRSSPLSRSPVQGKGKEGSSSKGVAAAGDRALKGAGGVSKAKKNSSYRPRGSKAHEDDDEDDNDEDDDGDEGRDSSDFDSNGED